jgi:predicted transposase YbfD/YdcC
LSKCNIAGKDITADALLTQRSIADYICKEGAYYHFTVKGNQKTLLDDIKTVFNKRGIADFETLDPPDHGRIEIRRIWCSNKINDFVDFPNVGQVFCIEREVVNKKSGIVSGETVYGITSRTMNEASPKRILEINRGHWAIEAVHNIIDRNFDEDRSRIRKGYGPENVTRLRRFAIGLLKTFKKSRDTIASMMRKLRLKPRRVLDYLRMTKNSNPTLARSLG